MKQIAEPAAAQAGNDGAGFAYGELMMLISLVFFVQLVAALAAQHASPAPSEIVVDHRRDREPSKSGVTPETVNDGVNYRLEGTVRAVAPATDGEPVIVEVSPEIFEALGASGTGIRFRKRKATQLFPQTSPLGR